MKKTMQWANPIQAAIDSLVDPDRTFSLGREKALSYLRAASATDYGDDIEAWIGWAKSETFIDQDYPGVISEEQPTNS